MRTVNSIRRYKALGRNAQILRSFSLVELVMVIVIMGIIAAIAVPRFAESIARQRLEMAAQRIVGDLDHAQQHARVSSTTVKVTFTKSEHMYELRGVPSPDHHGKDYTVLLAEPPYEVELVSVDFDGKNEVAIDGYGVAEAGGSVTIAAGGQKALVTWNGGERLIDLQLKAVTIESAPILKD